MIHTPRLVGNVYDVVDFVSCPSMSHRTLAIHWICFYIIKRGIR